MPSRMASEAERQPLLLWFGVVKYCDRHVRCRGRKTRSNATENTYKHTH